MSLATYDLFTDDECKAYACIIEKMNAIQRIRGQDVE
jgi:hypothetical protein